MNTRGTEVVEVANLKVSIGCNKKVGSDTAIINITSATDCPSRKLGLCQLGAECKKCYAMKAERVWKNTLAHRRQQEQIWDTISIEDAIKSLQSLLVKQHRDGYDAQKRELKFVRFSEAGDFRSQEDVDKLSNIAEGLKGKLKFYGYTARKDLDFSRVSENLVINGSGFSVHNEFKVMKEIPAGYPYVCKGDCRRCDLCKERRGIRILVKMH